MIVRCIANNLKKVAREVSRQSMRKICPAKFRLDGQLLGFRCNKQKTLMKKLVITMLFRIAVVNILSLDALTKF